MKLTHTGINFLIDFLGWIFTLLHLRSQRSLGSCISRETEPPTLSSKGCFVELIVAASSFALKIKLIWKMKMVWMVKKMMLVTIERDVASDAVKQGVLC